MVHEMLQWEMGPTFELTCANCIHVVGSYSYMHCFLSVAEVVKNSLRECVQKFNVNVIPRIKFQTGRPGKSKWAANIKLHFCSF